MGTFIGFCIVVAVIYFAFKSKKSNADFSNIINSYQPNTSNRRNNVYEVWVSGELTPACQEVLANVYNYHGKIYIQSPYGWFNDKESTQQAYVKYNADWTEESDDYISSLEKQANIMSYLSSSSGKMVVWCDADENWACNRRAFRYSSSGYEE